MVRKEIDNYSARDRRTACNFLDSRIIDYREELIAMATNPRDALDNPEVIEPFIKQSQHLQALIEELCRWYEIGG